MAGRKGKNKKVVKLDEHEDLYELFGEEDAQPVSFAEEFDLLVTDSDLQKAAAKRKARPQQKATVKDIVSSYPLPQTDLDLHRLSAEKAERRVRTFLGGAAIEKLKTVRIITGKGLHSDGPAVLPDVTEVVLQELKATGLLLHYQWEKKVKHKSGAVIVYLR